MGTHIIIWPFNRGWLNGLVLPLVEECGSRLTCDSALACGTKDQLMKKTLKKKNYWFKMSIKSSIFDLMPGLGLLKC